MATGWGGRRLGGRRSFRGPTYEDFVPPSGWTEDPERHNLMIDLPGFKMEDVKLRVDEKSGQLSVGGERKVDDQNKFRRFDVKVKLPDNSDATTMSAKFEGDVLLVVIPKEKKLEKENSEGDRNEVKKEKEPKILGDGEIEQKTSSNNGVVAPRDSGNGEAEKKTARIESEEKLLSAEAEAKNGIKSEIESTNSTNSEAENKSISHREEIDQTNLKRDEEKSVINSETEEKQFQENETEEKHLSNSETEEKQFQENEAEEKHLSNSETEKNLKDNEAEEKLPSKNDTEKKMSNNTEIEQNHPNNDEDKTEKKGDAEPLKKKEGTQRRVSKVHFHEEEEGVEKDGEKGNQLQSVMKMINEHKACILSALVAFALGLLASRSKQ